MTELFMHGRGNQGRRGEIMSRVIQLGRTLAAVLVVTGAAAAQEVRTIGPGMTEEQVQQSFGQPDGKASRVNFTFYFYNNGCERECGFPDLVIFQDGQVVDAVLRAPWHEYSGESSSPKGAIPRATPGGERLQVPERVESVGVQPAPPPERPDTTRSGG